MKNTNSDIIKSALDNRPHSKTQAIYLYCLSLKSDELLIYWAIKINNVFGCLFTQPTTFW